MATVIEELAIVLGWKVDDKPLTDASKKSQEEAKKTADAWRKSAADVGKAFLALGAAAAGAAVGIFKLVDGATKSADEIAKASRAAGISADSYQRLSFMAGRSGADMNVVSVAARKLSKNLLDASMGGGKLFTDTLGQIGVKLSDLEGQKPEDQIGLIADALNNVSDPAQRTAMSMALFGEEGGPKMASMLQLGSKGMKGLADEAKKLGLILDKDALDASEEFQDQLGDLKGTIGAVARDLGIALIPMVRDFVIQIKEWIGQNRELIQTKLQDFIKDVVKLVRELLPVVVNVVGALGKLVEVLGPTGAAGAMAGLKLATSGLGTSMMAALGPIGMVTAAVAALTLAFIDSTDNAIKARQATNDFLDGGTGKRGEGAKPLSSKREGELQDMRRQLADSARRHDANRRNLDLSPKLRTKAAAQFEKQMDRIRKIDAKIAKERSGAAEDKAFVEGQAPLTSDMFAPEMPPPPSTKPRGGGRRAPAAAPDLSELAGQTAASSNDPGLTDLLGSVGITSSPLEQLGLKSAPQVLINTTNNTYTQQFDINIDGAGSPVDVATNVREAFETLMGQDLERTSKMARAVFHR